MLEHWGDACYLISRSHVGTGTFLGRLPWLMISIWRLMGAFENGPFTSERVGNSNEPTTTKSHRREMLKWHSSHLDVFFFGCQKKLTLEKPCHSNAKMYRNPHPNCWRWILEENVPWVCWRRWHLDCGCFGLECLRDIEYIIHKQCLNHI